jgi:DNA-binding NarL/FixJ family response regulator
LSGVIRVAIHDEHEIFRRGLRASLESDPGVRVEPPHPPNAPDEEVDVAVVSAQIASERSFGCPLVLCVADHAGPPMVSAGNVIAGVLERSTVTEAQLHAAVRAAAAGLHINAERFGRVETAEVGPRAVRVLQLLADGHTTSEIAAQLSYSERTIKKSIHDLERHLDARSRPQVVAQAIRHGII